MSSRVSYSLCNIASGFRRNAVSRFDYFRLLSWERCPSVWNLRDPAKTMRLQSPNLDQLVGLGLITSTPEMTSLGVPGRLQIDLLLAFLKWDFSITAQPICECFSKAPFMRLNSPIASYKQVRCGWLTLTVGSKYLTGLHLIQPIFRTAADCFAECHRQNCNGRS